LIAKNNELQAWLNGNLTALNQFESSFNTAQTWLQSNITSYEAQVSALKAQISQTLNWLNGNITSYTSQINSLKSQVSDLQKQVASLVALPTWSVNNIQFDLEDLSHFRLNITNAANSPREINVTRVDLNQNATSIDPVIIAPAKSSIVVCGFNWTNFVGANVTVTVYESVYGKNETYFSQNLTLPYIKITNASFSSFPSGNPYLNLTVFDSPYSPTGINITQISFTVNNVTKQFDGTIAVPSFASTGYSLPVGSKVTFVLPWNWIAYSGQNVTFTVTLAKGTSVSAIFKVG
jgi:hypothetical protein